MITQLPQDEPRCYGSGCNLKQKCARNLTMGIDDAGLYSYYVRMDEGDPDDNCCESFIDVEASE
ncbi:MAG: hypothetical protein ACXV8O_01555 [Methylobacter sp.]